MGETEREGSVREVLLSVLSTPLGSLIVMWVVLLLAYVLAQAALPEKE